jgi:hypothetical protein
MAIDYGSDQGGGDSVTGNVGNEDADAGRVNGKTLVEITGHGCHGKVQRHNLQPVELRHFAGQDGELNPGGDFQFLIDFAQASLIQKRAQSKNTGQQNLKQSEAQWNRKGCRPDRA